MQVIHYLDGQSQAAKWALCGFLGIRGTKAGERIKPDIPYQWLDRDFPEGWRFCRRCERAYESGRRGEGD